MPTAPLLRATSNHPLALRALACTTLLVAVTGARGADAIPTAHEPSGEPGFVKVELPKEAEYLKTLALDKGLEANVWTVGPELANTVAIDLDFRNRLYAAQTWRFRLGGVLDVREHLYLYRDDLKNHTSADRLAMITKWASQGKLPLDVYTRYSERVTWAEDRAGSGRADTFKIFAEGFNGPLDGTAAGILVTDPTTVWFSCIPAITKLSDNTGTGVADARTVISDGYGPRFSLSGHDLHGLVRGPDGRVYWSVGDRGYSVTGQEGQAFADNMAGAVFRSELDGSGLELYYIGLRNPEELAFNADGDLFTVDNNADMGDEARVSWLLEGGDSGWQAGWQLLQSASFAKTAGLAGPQPDPWLDEGLWKIRHQGQPAYVLPPAGYCTSGPCGVAYFPSSGWAPSDQGRFLVCDYRGGFNSGIWSFGVTQKGATYAVTDTTKFVFNTPATDVAFGYDGRLYISEYLSQWCVGDQGRILTVTRPEFAGSAAVTDVKALFAAGFGRRSDAELATLLAHDDLRVRQQAQFALVGHRQGYQTLLDAATSARDVRARLHGIWGIGQLGRVQAKETAALLAKDPKAELGEALLAPLVRLLRDREPRVREQAAKVLGDDRYAPAGERLVRALRDDSARVRSFAAIALGRLRFADAVPGLVRLLAENDDVDAGLRHAGVMGLVGCSTPAELAGLVGDRRHAVRLGALLAMRRRHDARIAAFLDDPAADIWAEAVRAIYDLPIADAMPALIAHFGQPVPAGLPDKATHLLALRLIHAAARHGDDACAQRLAGYAAGTAGTPELRAAALATLLTWNHPNSIDPVLGRYRPALLRDKPLDTAALKDAVLRIVARGENESLGTAVILANQAGFPLDDHTLLAIVDNTVLPAAVRIEGLHQLVARANADVRGRLDRLLRDDQAEVRNAAFDALASFDQSASVQAAGRILDGGIGANPVSVITERVDGDWSELGIHAPALKPLTSDSSPLLGAVVRWVPGFTPPHKDAGAVDGTLPRLLDDQLPANDDDPAHSTFFDGGESRFVLDLQRSIEVARIATYSWHKAERAAQQFVLYGADGATMPDPASGTLGGWTRIARIDTTGQQAGGKQASCVLANAASMGRYRWLLWQNLAHGAGTFYAKLNVFAAGRPLPGVVRVIAARTAGEWSELPMGAPADGDDAAGKSVTWVAGAKLVGPHPDAGAQGQMLPRLTAGVLPTNDDDTLHSTWLDGGESRFVLDLLQPTALARISTYSWHKDERAGQHYALWGADSQHQPDAAGEDLWKSGWKRFAQVDTGWLGKGGKQGSAVVGVSGDLGTWRWVLWQNLDRKPLTGTFYTRLNLFAVGTTVPAIASAPDRVQLQAKQHVVLALGKDPSPAAAALLGTWVDRLVAGEAPPTLALELRDAAKARSEPSFAAALARLSAALPAGDPLAPFRIALAGGDAERGRDVFRQHAAQCIRCHAVDGDGGNVGPEMRGVANRLSRERILESLIVPNAVVAPGFGTASATLTDGGSVSGVWLGQTATEVVIRPAGAKEVHIPLAQVAKLTPPISPMPPMGGMLNAYELRDVLAFLNSLR